VVNPEEKRMGGLLSLRLWHLATPEKMADGPGDLQKGAKGQANWGEKGRNKKKGKTGTHRGGETSKIFGCFA